MFVILFYSKKPGKSPINLYFLCGAILNLFIKIVPLVKGEGLDSISRLA